MKPLRVASSVVAGVVAGLVVVGAVNAPSLFRHPRGDVGAAAVAVLESPSPTAEPVATPSSSPSTAPAATPTAKPSTAPAAPATSRPTAAPTVAPPPPAPKPVAHSVTWSDPSPSNPPTGGAYNGPTLVGTGATYPTITITAWRCTGTPPGPPAWSQTTDGFAFGIWDSTAGTISGTRPAVDWAKYPDGNGGESGTFQFATPSIPGDIYVPWVQFRGQGVMCDWTLTLTT